MKVCTLASGSSGNSLLLSHENTHILIDAGISARRIICGLKELGLSPASLSGILITHEHTDHISGLRVLLKQVPVPIYTTAATGIALRSKAPAAAEVLIPIRPDTPFSVGQLDCLAFSTSHDAADSVGFAVTAGGVKFALATDLGYVSERVWQGVQGAALAVVETNHDEDWLRAGPYPRALQERILGRRGHLSNEAGAELCRRLAESGTTRLVLAHLSRENNSPSQALDTVRRWLGPESQPGGSLQLEVAAPDCRGPVFDLGEAT